MYDITLDMTLNSIYLDPQHWFYQCKKSRKMTHMQVDGDVDYLSGNADGEYDWAPEEAAPEVALHPPPHPVRVARQADRTHRQAEHCTKHVKLIMWISHSRTGARGQEL